ncbi:MAG: host-nuclease inhibitor Gam family protein [Syntrophothermus sp.]
MENQIHRIESDKDAEKCLLAIKETKDNYQRQINCCLEMIEEYKYKVQQLKQRSADSMIPFESQLKEYFSRVKKHETKTQKTYTLPSGALKLKIKKPEIVRDEVKLLEFCKSNRLDDVIKTTQKVDWENLKKALKFDGKNAITEDGEVVPGIELVERDPEFVVEV